LSATPYKLFTVAGEEGISGDDHYRDFLATTRFLVRDDEVEVRRIESAFTNYRRALIDGVELESSRENAQTCLRRVMSRTERPTIGESRMGEEINGALGSPTVDEVVGYAAMDQLAMELDTTLPVEYWKSAPYFLNFMDGYKIGERFKSAIEEGNRPVIPKHAQVLSPQEIIRRQAVEPGNARLRELQRDLIDSGLWRLLWLPPSLPYLQPAGVYSSVNRTASTKRLIFSSWAAAPNSIAALLSHEVSRRVFEGIDEDSNPFERSARLEFRTGEDIGQGLTTLALVTPIPRLASLVDPLDFVRANNGEAVSPSAVLKKATEIIRPHIPSPDGGRLRASRESWYWAAPFRFIDTVDELLGLLESNHEDEPTSDEPTSRRAILQRRAAVRELKLGAAPADVAESVAMLGMFGPGNIAYRALKRVLGAVAPSESVLIRAAVIVGEGFRSLFNRPESMALVDLAHPEAEGAYWRRVLAYCADGDLQSVMDEYLHHVVGNSNPQSEQDILEVANIARDSMALKGSTVHLFNPKSPRTGFNVSTRFAVRYGSARGQAKSDEKSESRMSSVQQAFNSPFWPIVLASTSVGQEGVDFHWWCHSLVHWNLPSNPVDLEQREGRIHRFSGHAVRKNVAAAFGSEALRSDEVNPWVALFCAAVETRSSEVTEEIGDLWPWWVFPGDAMILTWTPALPFSKDVERDLRMRRLREIYRLAFGQPRQEELLSLLSIKAANIAPLDLRPPK
ncbi:MAG: helicase-related protein, partial [Acidimicrobiia bacterium]